MSSLCADRALPITRSPSARSAARLWRNGAQTLAILSTGTTGAAFTPEEFANYFLRHLFPQSVALSSGIRVLNTDNDTLSIPKMVDDVVSDWTAEAAEISLSDPSGASVVAVPRKLAALTIVSSETVEDSDPEIAEMIGESLARSMALKFDLGVYEGNGVAPSIRGFKSVSGIQTLSMGTNGATLTNLDPIADALGMLREADALGSAIVMHPRTWRSITKLKEAGSGNNKPLLADHASSPAGEVGGGARGDSVGSIYGVRVWLSSQLLIGETAGTGTALSSVYVYDAPRQIAVLRNDGTIEADGSVKFTSDQIAVRGKMRADMVVPYPESVVRISGIAA